MWPRCEIIDIKSVFHNKRDSTANTAASESCLTFYGHNEPHFINNGVTVTVIYCSCYVLIKFLLFFFSFEFAANYC